MTTRYFCPNCAFQYVARPLPERCEGCGEPLVKVGKKRGKPRRKSNMNSRQRRDKVQRLAKRDGWGCWLCRKPIDSRLDPDDEMGVTLDHVLKLQDGGTNHDYNLRLAHRACNNARDAKFPDTAVKAHSLC